MTKAELLKTVEILPQEFIEKAYALDFVNGNIQLDYDSNLVVKYGMEGKTTDNGYYEFVLKINSYRFKICMT